MSKKRKRLVVARPYIILADGTRLEEGDTVTAELAKTLPASFVREA